MLYDIFRCLIGYGFNCFLILGLLLYGKGKKNFYIFVIVMLNCLL